MTEAVPADPFERRMLASIIVLAVLLRFVCGALLPDQHIPDADVYRAAAQGLREGGLLNAAHIMPLYPILIAITGPGWGQLLLDIILSTAVVWLVFELTLSVFGDRVAALLAAFAAAIYPYFIFYSALGLTEPLFFTLLLAAYVAWYRGRFTTAAIAAVLAILTRPIIDPLVPVLVLAFAVGVHQLTIAASLRRLAAYVLIYCALLAPWWVHNYAAYGTFVRLNLGAGVVLYEGNHPDNHKGGGTLPGEIDFSAFDSIRDPLARDRAMWDAGMRFIIDDPRRFIENAGIKFLRFWRPWPYAQGYSGLLYVAASAASFVPVLLLSLLYLLGWGWRDRRRITPMLLFAAYLTAIHMVFLASLRYRLPIELFMIVFAAVAVARLARHPAVERLVLRRRNAERSS
jgi:4-amino-4-deoxy-L-arabinose transferase-like glycosyltransferase